MPSSRHLDIDRNRGVRARDADRPPIRDIDRVRSERDGKRLNENDRIRPPRESRETIRDKTSSSAASKLRMDRDRHREGSDRTNYRAPPPHPPSDREISRMTGDSGRKQPQRELDQVVQRAKEERSSYWNKRVIEQEEKDPNRWGHSGFASMYRRDMKLPPPARPRSRSRSPVLTNSNKHFRGSPERQQRHREAPPPRRSRSRSRSPRNHKPTKSRNELRRSVSPPKQRNSNNPNFVPLGPRPTAGNIRRASPLLGRMLPDSKHERRSGGTREYGNNNNNNNNNSGSGKSRNSGEMKERRHHHGTKESSSNKSSSLNDSYSRSRLDRDRERHSAKRENPRGFRSSSSVSRSRSRSRSTTSPRSNKRSIGNLGGSSKSDPKNKDSWNRTSSKSKLISSKSHSRSGSKSGSSSSSSSSEDEDVLELHATENKKKGRGSSISRSSSSSSDSKSSTSSPSSSKRKAASDSSSSSSSGDSDSDESDVSGKITMDRTKKSNVKPVKPVKDSNKSKETEHHGNKTATKRPLPTPTPTAANKTSRTSSKSASASSSSSKPKPKPKPSSRAASKGDSDSESGSTSDSDSEGSEPRMTLSERFAKLTQMSTDKREFAKPLLAVNEIDTKLKVVKDLRNADVKIYVDGPPHMQQQQQQRSSNSANLKPRPKSPEYTYADGEKRFTSDERRRHFERMAKDEPAERERPPEWANARVRYEYYRDRGCFNERPLNFEEYVKWEEWWYQYRDWLQNEGYFPRSPAPPPSRGPNFPGGMMEGMNRGLPPGRNGDWNEPPPGSRLRLRPGPPPGEMLPPLPTGRRVEQVPGRLIPLSSRPHFMPGRPIESHHPLPPPPHVGRSIGRAPSGSLIVNIRQGPRGRHVGLLRGRNR